jgi:hypothetical protein
MFLGKKRDWVRVVLLSAIVVFAISMAFLGWSVYSSNQSTQVKVWTAQLCNGALTTIAGSQQPVFNCPASIQAGTSVGVYSPAPVPIPQSTVTADQAAKCAAYWAQFRTHPEPGYEGCYGGLSLLGYFVPEPFATWLLIIVGVVVLFSTGFTLAIAIVKLRRR